MAMEGVGVQEFEVQSSEFRVGVGSRIVVGKSEVF
jgi:hypothetical protein